MTGFRISLPRLAAGVLLATVLGLTTRAAAQIVVHPIELQTAAGPVRGLVGVVDLSDPHVRICVTGPFHPKVPSTRPGKGPDAALIPVDRWAHDHDVALAVNANYFGWTPGGGVLIGWVVSDGVAVSPTRSWKGRPDPSLVFVKDAAGWTARVVGQGQPPVDPGAVRYAVSGVGGSASDDVAGTLLVQAGKNCGATARVYPDRRLARTAAGVDASGHRLTLIAIDGRQPTWSVGINLPDLADLLIRSGVHDAINLDGGGSTSFVCHLHPQDPFQTNRPCDEAATGKPGVFRAVACALGFQLESGGTPGDPHE